MIIALSIFHGFVSVLLIILVLLQFGRGAELGATMGAGSSQSVFTSSQSGNIFSKATTVLVLLFLGNSVLMSVIITKQSQSSLFDNEAPVAAPLNSDAQADAQKKADGQGPNNVEGQAPANVTPVASPAASTPIAQ